MYYVVRVNHGMSPGACRRLSFEVAEAGIPLLLAAHEIARVALRAD